MMSKLIGAAGLSLALLAPSAQAADEKKAPTAQQSKMTTCNKEATGKTGDDRKAFMKECLAAKADPDTAAATPQQERMKTCNKEATGKTGDARKAFMKECLSKKA